MDPPLGIGPARINAWVGKLSWPIRAEETKRDRKAAGPAADPRQA